MINPDKHFMQRCIELSQLSIDNGDAPFGSLITKDNKLIAEGVNAANTKVSVLLGIWHVICIHHW